MTLSVECENRDLVAASDIMCCSPVAAIVWLHIERIIEGGAGLLQGGITSITNFHLTAPS